MKRKTEAFTMPFGTQLMPAAGTLFQLWAPDAEKVELCLHPNLSTRQCIEMRSDSEGWFHLHHAKAGIGDTYLFRIDGNSLVPDPASRYQADDVHGPSVVCDPNVYNWEDQAWSGRSWEEAVIYELHVGTFTPEGTFRAALEKLDYLADLGVTAIEIMPVAQFPGRFNWGYDGVLLFAPCNCYGYPEDLKKLIDSAHAKGLMVFLDVVFNHFGPEGNYLYLYAKSAFFTDAYQTPWGAAINYSGPQSRSVRDFFIANALYWLEEFHVDGLRFDAVHTIFDHSSPDILEEIAATIHQGPGNRRKIHLILENDHNQASYLERDSDGRIRHFTAQWNDDIHHALHVLITGESSGYYSDYTKSPIRHLGRCLAEGFAYQGEASPYRQGRTRGESSRHLPPLAFISFLQNHDQIGNRALGERLHSLADPDDLIICTALVLLAPFPPLLFMGEEFGATDPFYFFCDFGADLTDQVTEGRRREFAAFPQFNTAQARQKIPDPNSENTFINSKLDWGRLYQGANRSFFNIYHELLTIRHRHIIPRLSSVQGAQADFQILTEKALAAWWQLGDGTELKVLLNLSSQMLPQVDSSETDGLLYRYIAPGRFKDDSPGLPPKSIHWHHLT